MTDDERGARGDGLVIPESLENTYDLLELLRESADHWTLLVKRKSDGKRCVAKILQGAWLPSGKREADILGRLDHPNIPRLIEYREEGDTCVLIRECAEGKPLDQYAAERVMTESTVIDIGIRICRVLEYLHGLPEPVIHRDIKPQNVIIDSQGEIHLIDFGNSRVANPRNTVDTFFSGTAAYAPPEQYGFRQTDRRADVYSLGVLLHFLLVGSVDTTSDKRGVQGSYLNVIIRKCTSLDPKNRFQSVKELRQRLTRLNRRSVPYALMAELLALFLIAGVAMGILVGVTGKQNGTRAGDSVSSEPVMEGVRLSDVLKLNDMTEEERLSITGIYIYGDTVFDSLYTKNAADPSGEKISVNPYISGHPYVVTAESGEIEISDGVITDISCLRSLKKLREVVIARNNISDLSPLEDLTKLEFLDLSNNPITDVRPLRSLSSLRKLYLSSCTISDPYPLYGLSSLEVLCVAGNRISALQGVDSLQNLREIDVGANQLVDVSVLGKLPLLERIMIGNNGVTDLSFLRFLDSNRIVDLDIRGLPVTDVSPLKTGRLFNNHCSIRVNAEELGEMDLSFLRDIMTFNELRLEGTDCSQLGRYLSGKRVMWLCVSNTGLRDIDWLETVTDTWNLEIAHNPSIRDLTVLTKMKSLQTVRISEDMRPLTEAMTDDVGFTFQWV